MDVDAAFAPLRCAFPQKAEFQGTHFTYASRAGAVLIETRKKIHLDDHRCDCCGRHIGETEKRFFYWLQVDGRFVLVNAKADARGDGKLLKPMRTIGESFRPFFTQ